MHLRLAHVRRLAATACMLAASGSALAADHAEAPGTQADPAADISDFYAWHNTDGNLVVVFTVAPLTAAGGAATYDADLLFGVHFDNDLDGVADHDVWVRFGQNTAGDWGVQATGIPGADASFHGAVDTAIADSTGTAMLWAGLSDDPFFFDFQGFVDTLSTGTVAFTAADTFAGTNTTTVVMEFPYSGVVNGDGFVQTWATSGRK